MKAASIFALLILLLTGCSSSMSDAQAGERVLYLLCSSRAASQATAQAMRDDDLNAYREAKSQDLALSEQTYREFSEESRWPFSIREEIAEYAQLELESLLYESRLLEAARKSGSILESFTDPALFGLTPGDSNNRRGELATVIRVKLGLSLDRESSCAGY